MTAIVYNCNSLHCCSIFDITVLPQESECFSMSCIIEESTCLLVFCGWTEKLDRIVFAIVFQGDLRGRAGSFSWSGVV